MDENFLLEMANLKVAIVPVDLNTGANAGARIPMGKCKRVAFICNFGTSTAATVNATLQQHNAASAGSSKALSVDNPYWVKHGTATSFTKTVPGAAASAFDVSTQFAADGGVAVFEVLAQDLDVENDFNYVSLSLDDTTAAKLGGVVAVLYDTVSNPPYGDVV